MAIGAGLIDPLSAEITLVLPTTTPANPAWSTTS
jgi:hypothetical protein